jgi:hypothetical protein
MRDEHYKNCCEFPGDYDSVINAIKRFNTYISSKTDEEKEEFASDCVNSCIRGVLYDERNGLYLATGGALAVRASTNPNIPGYHKVLLCTHGLSF